MEPRGPTAAADGALLFGPFRLLPRQKLLLLAEQPVKLGGRALDLLIALALRAGGTVGRAELMALVWPDTRVEENTLRVHMAALRKALGDGRNGARYIATAKGRGYSFVAPVATAPASASPESAPSRLPAAPDRIIGRDRVIARLDAQLRQHRLVSVVGPGGIGKTTVALAAAHAAQGRFPDGACFVDLSPLPDPALVPVALAQALGLAISSGDPGREVARYLARRECLILLDTCEHVIEEASRLASELLQAAPDLRLLATSREPLRVPGETVIRVPPLELPDPGAADDAERLRRCAAVQLLAERAAAADESFVLDGTRARQAAELCLRLEGIPLAIELAAARLGQIDIAELLARFDDRLSLLSHGFRTAAPRQRTLRATLDWSYGLLTPQEQRIFRALGAFRGHFDLDAAQHLASAPGLAPAAVVEGLAGLVAKSLLGVSDSAGTRSYRLLDTARSYALEKLAAEGDAAIVFRRHAAHGLERLSEAARRGDAAPPAEWQSVHGRLIDDVRAALDWAFSPNGDRALGLALTLAAVPLWSHLSLVGESRGRAVRAIEALREEERSSGTAMRLHAALGGALVNIHGSGRAQHAAWAEVVRIACLLGDAEHEARGLWGLWAGHRNNAEYAEAMATAEAFQRLAEAMDDPRHRRIARRLMGVSCFYYGRLEEAERQIRTMLAEGGGLAARSDIPGFQFDQRISARCTLAQTLWLRGHPDQALALAAENVEEALALNHPGSLAYAIVLGACPVAFFAGELDLLERMLGLALERSAGHGLDGWSLAAGCFSGLLRIRRGEGQAATKALREAIDLLGRVRAAAVSMCSLAELALALSEAGDGDRAEAAIEEALALSARSGERWCRPELLRVKAEVLLRRDPARSGEAAALLAESLELARASGALSWELRTATSHAALLRRAGRAREALDLLAPVQARFRVGHGTADLQRATALLAELRRASGARVRLIQ